VSDCGVLVLLLPSDAFSNSRHLFWFSSVLLIGAVSVLFCDLGVGAEACLCSAGFGGSATAIAVLVSVSFLTP
jgi:hypothetical protein